jgi:FG-GAP repeat
VSNYTDSTVNLALGSSGGSYTVVGPFSVGNSPYSAAVGDLNLDGTPDLAVANCFSNNTGVLLDGTLISVPYSGLSLPAGDSFNASYTPDGVSKYGSSNSGNIGDTSRNGNLCTLTKVFDRWGCHALASNLSITRLFRRFGVNFREPGFPAKRIWPLAADPSDQNPCLLPS